MAYEFWEVVVKLSAMVTKSSAANVNVRPGLAPVHWMIYTVSFVVLSIWSINVEEAPVTIYA
ncbi:MAG: hypothetical protein QF535_01100 [Anaerolineales bacterium]|nr:hypothetical protein [Anaerolineales bacterium]